MVATSAQADDTVFSYSFSQHTILLVGNETKGLSSFLKEQADDLVKLPMIGSASSLNIACATTVFIYEIMRQRND